jgi:hypothetical protein
MGEGEVVCGGEQALEWKVGKRYTGDNPKGCQPRNNMGAAWTPIAHMGHSMRSINGGGGRNATRPAAHHVLTTIVVGMRL